MPMPVKKRSKRRSPIVLPPGGGRQYPMGRIHTTFKADNDETGRAYSVSEWWLEANTKGPGVHTNPEDHAWYVIEGTMTVVLGKRRLDLPKGSFVLIPGGVPHTFENRSRKRAGILNFDNEAGFEDDMPGISAWFKEHPAERVV
jgi:mannose-6-phosphate isomerase-like protein (cupin superfamily)